MTHPNETVARQVYEAFQTGDVDTLKGLVSPDVRWHEAGSPEVIQGREAVQARLGMVAGLENDLELHTVLADDDHVVSLVTARLRKPNGDEVSYPVVEVVHVQDGMVTERWAFMDAVPPDVQAFFADLG
ncbi:MAG: nuclear transport factor 2 family protein [Sporichthyaceae bacterium]